MSSFCWKYFSFTWNILIYCGVLVVLGCRLFWVLWLTLTLPFSRGGDAIVQCSQWEWQCSTYTSHTPNLVELFTEKSPQSFCWWETISELGQDLSTARLSLRLWPVHHSNTNTHSIESTEAEFCKNVSGSFNKSVARIGRNKRPKWVENSILQPKDSGVDLVNYFLTFYISET